MALSVVINKDNGTEICRANFVEVDYIHDSDQRISSGDSTRVPGSRPTVTRVQLGDVSFPDIVYPGQGRYDLNPSAPRVRENELEFLLAALIKMMGGGVTLTDVEVIRARDLKFVASWTNDGRWKLEVVER